MYEPSVVDIEGRLSNNIDHNRSHVITTSERLDRWDMTIIKRYVVEQGLYAQDEVGVVEREYKRWMALAVCHSNMNIAMSRAVDNFWHAHILFTQDYTAMCQEIFGKYIHHRPCILDSGKALDRFFRENTIELYRRHFGSPDPKYWNAAICQYCSHTIEQ